MDRRGVENGHGWPLWLTPWEALLVCKTGCTTMACATTEEGSWIVPTAGVGAIYLPRPRAGYRGDSALPIIKGLLELLSRAVPGALSKTT